MKNLSYTEYLKIGELLQLQQALSKPPHPDEMQFIIVHQAFELWFKLIIQELDRACEFMRKADRHATQAAIHCLRRVIEIEKLLIQQIHILETMRPVDFLQFRKNLNPASGFQSTQFREIEFLCGLKNEKLLELCTGEPELVKKARERFYGPTVWDAFCQLLQQRGMDVKPGGNRNVEELLKLYQSPNDYPGLYELTELLMDFDEYFQLWRHHHVNMVERMIGNKPGTGAPVNQGYDGAKYLQSTVSKRCFPELWQVRSRLGMD